MKIKQLYVFYSNSAGYPAYIQLLDEVKYNEFKGWQPDDVDLHASTIHSDSTREDDPVISIIAVTKHKKLGQQNAAEIDQQVINWLMENGHMPMR